MDLSCVAFRPADDPALRPTLPASFHPQARTARHERLDRDTTGLLAGAMDLLCDGIALTDGASRVLHMNHSMRTFVSRGLLSVRAGWLHAAVPSETQALQMLIAACVEGDGKHAHMRVGARLCLTITALEATADAQGAAMILARDLKAPHGPPPPSTIAYFGLTPAEAKVAREIVNGDGLTRCARRLGVRVTTVRSHLKHIFEKTDTRRQADLVRLLVSCGSSIAAPRSWPGASSLDGLAWPHGQG